MRPSSTWKNPRPVYKAFCSLANPDASNSIGRLSTKRRARAITSSNGRNASCQRSGTSFERGASSIPQRRFHVLSCSFSSRIPACDSSALTVDDILSCRALIDRPQLFSEVALANQRHPGSRTVLLLLYIFSTSTLPAFAETYGWIKV